MYIYIIFHIFPIMINHQTLNIFPILYSKTLFFLHFIYHSVYLVIPNSSFISLPLSLSVTISLFSTPVSLFLFCK